MLFFGRKASLLLSGFLFSSAVSAAEIKPPSGYWLLENSDEEKPFGGLKLDRPDHFSLLVFDSNCELYRVDGSIKRKKTHGN